ncbi:MAG: Na+/H+ antiporter NhaC family protein [Saprospiraceae bacterium]|nr:Na+/H+ antiporter NhaC family protein [Saprospiraceae bacterium]
MKTIYKTTISIFLYVLVYNCLSGQTPDSLNVPAITEENFSITDTAGIEKLNLISEGNSIYFAATSAKIGKIEINGDGKFLEKSENGLYLLPLELSHAGQLLFVRSVENRKEMSLVHVAKLTDTTARVKEIPLWMSVIPPLLAIIFALIFKEVVLSLLLGVWSGAFIAGGLRLDSLYYFLLSVLQTVQKFVVEAMTDSGHVSVMVFSLMIGGMVAIISKNGGMAGVVLALARYAKSSKSTQFVTWLLGIAIFFDDYANTLIVGNTMRPVTDKFRISREKLAYIVDSTAAPVAAIAFITTWIGAELGYIDSGMTQIAMPNEMTPYAIFISSLKYSYYPFLTLAFILILIYTGKDFGPMVKAEQRAFNGQVSSASTSAEDEPNMEDLSPVPGAKLQWQNAAFPVLTVIFVTIFGLLDTGFDSLYGSMDHSLTDYSWISIWQNMGSLFPGSDVGFLTKLGKVIGSADSYVALLWSSFSGLFVAVVMTVSKKIMKMLDVMHWMVSGFKTMMPALIILVLAWSLASTTQLLHTADFISGSLEGNLNPVWMPAVIFVLAAFISFSTGSSWSTMAILYPIAIPATYAVCIAAGMDANHTLELMLNVIATVLAASVLGDHCSPISDTTILSSLASDCNHIDHVRTQMPYALVVGFVSICCVTVSGMIAGGVFINFLIFLIALVILWAIVSKFGKKIDMQ